MNTKVKAKLDEMVIVTNIHEQGSPYEPMSLSIRPIVNTNRSNNSYLYSERTLRVVSQDFDKPLMNNIFIGAILLIKTSNQMINGVKHEYIDEFIFDIELETLNTLKRIERNLDREYRVVPERG